MKLSKRAWLAGLAVIGMLGPVRSLLQAQTAVPGALATYDAGRILKADGTKIRVASLVIETSRIAYRVDASAGTAFLDLSKVNLVQIRRPATFIRVGRAFVLGAFLGGVVGLLASDRWGGPGKNTWPGIGAGAALFGAAGAVMALTIRSYETVYSNPDYKPEKIIKFSLGPVSPTASGLGISFGF
jgi:hypothetical protein